MNNQKVSLRGRFFRKSIKLFMDFPLMKKTGFLENGARVSHMKSRWNPPKGYSLFKYDLGGLPVELLEKNNGNQEKVILHFHGGAYVFRYFDFYRIISLRYSKLAQGASVVSIDYRTAPNHKYPDALNDAMKAWEWLLAQGYKEENIIIAGDSAGGNLALALTMKLRDEGKKLATGLVLMSPLADFDEHGPSYVYNVYKDPLFGKKKGKKEPKGEQMHHLLRSYATGASDFKDRYVSPAYGDFNDFPSMLIQVGSFEVIESDSITVYEKAKKVGVDVKLSRYYGMFHDFQMLLNFIPESKKAWFEVKDFINKQFYK